MNIIVKHGFKKDLILHFLICRNISYPFPSAKVRLKVIYTSKLFIFFYCLTFSVEELKLSWTYIVWMMFYFTNMAQCDGSHFWFD